MGKQKKPLEVLATVAREAVLQQVVGVLDKRLWAAKARWVRDRSEHNFGRWVEAGIARRVVRRLMRAKRGGK